MALLTNKSNKFSASRRRWWGFLIGVLVVYAALYFSHAAAISGMSMREMDWNNDGKVDFHEFAQSFYAVAANAKTDGGRTCTTYAWHGGEAIKVECKTEFGKK